MASLTALLLLGTLASAASPGPRPSGLPRCARECPMAGSPKFAFEPEKTYSYSYTGKSEIQMKDVEGGVSQMEWTSQVDLTWLTPCDVAVTFKNPAFGGAAGTPEANFLTRYPLVVAMTDGRVQHVCSHPDDDTWSINLKKGVASAFQNSLPSNSSVNSGLNFTETDVAGKCPTLYKVKNEGEKVTVEKIKNHRYCQERFPSQSETPMSWIKTPLPLQESKSECKQEIKKGIYTSISCEDKNVIKPALGSYKYVVAKQVSKLELQSEASSAPQSLNNIRGRMVEKSLKYDHETLKKDPSLVPQLEQVLKEVCDKTKEGVEKETASLVGKAIHLLRRVPEESVEQMAQKVKSGEICSEKQKMESLFMDAVAFVQEASTVKLMVNDILNSRTTGGREALYIAALYFTPRPSLRAVEAVKPLFEKADQFPMASLAAATLVNTYCRHHPHCFDEAPVRQAAEVLANKIQQKCASPSEEAQKDCVASIKSLGNMGVMTSSVARTVISFIERESAPKHLRVAAAQAFRNAKCARESTKHLVRIAVDPKKNTEIRIASYLAAIRCAEEEDLIKISDKISEEENTQVRGFILSHLLNLQESSVPHKEQLRYVLSSISIPTNFSGDVRKYSRNIDLSYYSPSLGVGAGMESNIIHSPGSFVPRSVNFNFTSAFGATPVNFGEFGARVEGLEPMLEKVFGPEGYFQKSSMSKIVRDISRYTGRTAGEIVEHVEERLRQRRTIDFTTLTHFFSNLYGEREFPRADVFARFGGQEVAYVSLSKAMWQNINIDEVIDSLFDLFEEAVGKMSQTDVDTARALQMSLDYSLPTIQGVPLKMKLNGTVVVGLKLESRMDSTPKKLKVMPSVSAELHGFIGYSAFIASCGVRTKNRVASNNGLSINLKNGMSYDLELDIPHKMDVLDIKSETYLMKLVKGQPEIRINPTGVRQSRIEHHGCINALEEKIGLKVCYELNAPNVFASQGLPLGQPTAAKLTIEKSESSMRGYRVKADIENTPNKKEVKLMMETPGSTTPRKAEGHLSYSKESESYKMEAAVSSQSSGGLKVELKAKYSDAERELQLNAFRSQSPQFSPESQVLEAKFSSNFNGQESRVRILTQTKNTLKEQYIDHYFEVIGDMEYSPRTKLSYPRRLEKFDLKTKVQNYELITSVQKRSESDYVTQVKAGSKSNALIDMEATHKLEGSWENGISSKTEMTAKLGSSQYRANLDLSNSREKIGILIQVVQEGVKLIELETFVAKPSESTYKAKFQIDIPQYMRPIKFESKLEGEDSHRYQLQSLLEHGSQVIVQADGPITAKFSSSMKQLQVDVRVQTLVSEPHRVSSTMIWARNKQELAFELKNTEQSLFILEWNMSAESEEQTKAGFKCIVPSIIDHKADAIISRKHIQINFNSVVSPKNSPRRVKGFADVDYENKKAKAELYWDADRSPDKKISVETAIQSGSSSQHTIMHGGWTYMGSTYHYKADVARSDSETWVFGRKDIKIELSTPAQKTYSLNTVLNVQGASSRTQVEAEFRYKNPQEKETKASWSVAIERQEMTYNFKFNSKADLTSAEGQQSSLSLEAVHESSRSQRTIFAKINMRCPSLTKPLETSFSLRHERDSYQAKWKVGAESPAEGAKYEIRFSPEGGVQVFNVEMNAKEIATMLKAVQKVAGMEQREESAREAKYLIRYEKPTETSQKIRIHCPSRQMEGDLKYSPSEYSVRFYPRKESSEAKYELSLTQSKTSSPWEEEIKYKGRFVHPSQAREKNLEILYSNNEQKTQGTAKIDVFQSSEDAIIGTLESVKTARNSVEIEAKLNGKVLKVNPRIKVAYSYAPHTKGFDLLFEKTPSSNPSLIISGKYDRSSGRNAALAFNILTEEGPVVEISGSVKPEQEPKCNGLKISAFARSSVIGNYDIFSKLCKPSFVMVHVKKQDSNKAYIARVGIQALKNIEVSLTEKDESSQKERHISMVRVKLASSTLINAEAKYVSEKVSELWDSVQEKLSRMSSAALSWSDLISQEILKTSGSSNISSEVARLWEDFKKEMEGIYNDMVHDNLIPSYETVQRLARSNLVHSVISVYKQIWSQVDELKKWMYSAIPRAVTSLKNEFEGLTRFINTAVIGSARWIKTGDMPQEIRNLVDEIKDSKLYEDVMQFLYDVGDMLLQDIQAIDYIFEKCAKTLVYDLEQIREDLMNHVSVQNIIDWIINHLNFEKEVTKKFERALDKIIQESLFASVQIRGSHIEMQIPLRQPVNSIPQAWKFASTSPIPIYENVLRLYEAMTMRSADYLVWSYYTLLPRHISDLLPPFNRTAMIVDGSEILTFDGTVLRAPHSPCQVVLAAFQSHTKLIMEHPQSSSSPQLTLKTKQASVVVTNDHKVKINGREIRGQETSEGDVRVYQSAQKIKVMSPYFTVRVYPRNNVVSVEVSGWTFGQVAGLLGTYDSELANDWATSQGSMASNLEELVRSWQENQSCQTPNISPLDKGKVPALKLLQCNALFGVRSRCNSLVRPDAFNLMCQASRNPCNVARAYSVICSRKGVKDIFPVTC